MNTNTNTLNIGETIITNNNLRVQRYRSSLLVTDLTNAGKRGKKCTGVCLYDYDIATHDNLGATAALETVIRVVQSAETISQVECLFGAYCAMIEKKGFYTAKCETRSLRGVDVIPAGVEKLTVHSPKVYIEADGQTFMVRDLRDPINEPTLIPPSRASKTAAKLFYAYVKANFSVLTSYSFNDVYRGMSDAGIGCHYFCAVD